MQIILLPNLTLYRDTSTARRLIREQHVEKIERRIRLMDCMGIISEATELSVTDPETPKILRMFGFGKKFRLVFADGRPVSKEPDGTYRGENGTQYWEIPTL